MRMSSLLLLFLLPCLQSCAGSRQTIQPVAPIEVAEPAFVALPAEFTRLPAEPEAPLPIALDAEGIPSITGEQFAAWFESWRAWGCGLAAQVVSVAALQPDPIAQPFGPTCERLNRKAR